MPAGAAHAKDGQNRMCLDTSLLKAFKSQAGRNADQGSHTVLGFTTERDESMTILVNSCIKDSDSIGMK